MNFNIKILIVEDEIIIADYIYNILTKEGYSNVKMAHKQISALAIMKEFQPEIILLDINLNGINSGIDLAKNEAQNAKVIFLTGQYDESLMTQALATNPESYLTKPIKREDLVAAVKLVMLKSQSKKLPLKMVMIWSISTMIIFFSLKVIIITSTYKLLPKNIRFVNL